MGKGYNIPTLPLAFDIESRDITTGEQGQSCFGGIKGDSSNNS